MWHQVAQAHSWSPHARRIWASKRSSLGPPSSLANLNGVLPHCHWQICFETFAASVRSSNWSNIQTTMPSQTCLDSGVKTTDWARQGRYRWTWARCVRTGSSMQKLRLSAPRYRTLGERGRSWKTRRQTVKSRFIVGHHAQGICSHSAQTSTFLRQPAALKAPRATQLFSC